ncbi:MAG: helix-turn-helix domain-containing protein [Atopobium sp.]|nr:helix-turn-helix domain-containing protein [Atopobium sp.]
MREDGVRKHMGRDGRAIIEEGLERSDSARRIAREAGLSPSTVTREAMRSRTVTERKRMPGANLSVRCARRDGRTRVVGTFPDGRSVDGKVFYRRCGKDSFQVHGNDFFLTRDKE